MKQLKKALDPSYIFAPRTYLGRIWWVRLLTKYQLKNLGMKKNVCSKNAFIADYAYQPAQHTFQMEKKWILLVDVYICLLYTSDAADE